MVYVGLYEPTSLVLVRQEGPFPQDNMPWEDIRLWQAIYEIVIRVRLDG